MAKIVEKWNQKHEKGPKIEKNQDLRVKTWILHCENIKKSEKMYKNC